MTEAAQNLTDRLNNAYDRFLASLPENTYAMLGKRFCPRIRKVQKQRIYRINTHYDYGAIGPLVSRGERQIQMHPIVETWDRMGQFYATLQSGHTTSSVALKRLNSIATLSW